MNYILSYFKNVKFNEKSVPLAILLASLTSFGLLLPSLGYYMDDWPYVFYAYNKGITSLSEMLYYDSRPMAAWLYQVGFTIFGFTPLIWHVASLLMRVTTGILLWILLRSIWPFRQKEASYIALLFTVYPFFMLQPFAVGSTHHWFGFIAFLVSLLCMTNITDKFGGAKFFLMALSLCFEAAHLFTSEYFSGLEFIRPVILWMLFSRKPLSFRQRSIQTLLTWLPYIFILGLFTYWRVVVFQNPPEVTRNTPIVFLQLFSQPFSAIQQLLFAGVKDTIAILTVGWLSAIDVETLNLNSPYTQFRVLASTLFFVAIYYYLARLQFETDENNQKDDWPAYSFSVALIATLIAGLPVWLIGRSIVESKNLISASRFGLPSTLGVAFLLYLLVDYFVTEQNKKRVLFTFLLALGASFHINNTGQFRDSWEKQNRLVQELTWRAPAIQSGTAIVTDEEILGVMGDYATSFMLNTAYQPKAIHNTPPYWFFPYFYTYPDLELLIKGIPLEGQKLSMRFDGTSNQMLLISFNPEMDRCLWILQPQDQNLRLVSQDMRQLSIKSNIEVVQFNETSSIPNAIFTELSQPSWCYYFEKADLARQLKQWDQIPSLWMEAETKGISAGNGFEYIPFIEGFAHTGNWEKAKRLTKQANKVTEGLEPSLCSALDRIRESIKASAENDKLLINLKEDLNCKNFQ